MLRVVWLMFCLGVACAWDKHNADAHEVVKQFWKAHPDILDQPDMPSDHAGSTALRNIPASLEQFASCVFKSSQDGFWSPAFRYDTDPLMQADNARRLDVIGWINEEKKNMYLQIPKSASTSIKSHLKNHGYRSITSQRQLPRNFQMADYFVWTFVREPLRRFNSAFGTISARIKNDTEKEYETFVQDLLRNNQKFYASHHALPQRFFISNDRGIPFRLNFVGKIENFKADWKALNGHIHLPPPPEKRNVDEGSPQIINWLEKRAPPELRAALCNYYLADYLCFEYAIPEVCNITPDEVEKAAFQNLQEWKQTVYGF